MIDQKAMASSAGWTSPVANAAWCALEAVTAHGWHGSAAVGGERGG
jgi:hypothetical protein